MMRKYFKYTLVCLNKFYQQILYWIVNVITESVIVKNVGLFDDYL